MSSLKKALNKFNIWWGLLFYDSGAGMVVVFMIIVLFMVFMLGGFAFGHFRIISGLSVVICVYLISIIQLYGDSKRNHKILIIEADLFLDHGNFPRPLGKKLSWLKGGVEVAKDPKKLSGWMFETNKWMNNWETCCSLEKELLKTSDQIDFLEKERDAKIEKVGKLTKKLM